MKMLAYYGSFTIPDSNKLNSIYAKVIPDSSMRMAVIGYSQYRENHLASAESYFAKALELQPDFGEVHMCLSDVEKMLGKSTESEYHLRIAREYGIHESIDD